MEFSGKEYLQAEPGEPRAGNEESICSAAKIAAKGEHHRGAEYYQSALSPRAHEVLSYSVCTRASDSAYSRSRRLQQPIIHRVCRDEVERCINRCCKS
jgi:hypothetical protein